VYAGAPTRPAHEARLPRKRVIARSCCHPEALRDPHLFSIHLELHLMYRIKTLAAVFSTIVIMATLGCASTRTHEGAGQYVDDSVITAKVKTAILNEPGLSVSEVNVETYKGAVQLSGFVSSRADIASAVRVARAVNGVSSVTNDMRLK
jgi:hypothetical protein